MDRIDRNNFIYIGHQLMERKFINDIVHGIIELPSYIVEIIDSVPFQRLRFISQMSFTHFVYPSANNTRFEHSIGTFHLASILLRQLQNQHEISDSDKKCVEIAALCHDLGHGPFSHLWDKLMDRISGTHKKHELLSCEIFRDLMNSKKSGETQLIKEKLGINDNMTDFICQLILGDYNAEINFNKRFLFEIVANKDSGLDVDKFDYLCRDTIYLGGSNINMIKDIKRIIYFMRVVRNEDETNGEWCLAMREREIFHIYDIFYYRHLLNRYGYQHKTSKSISCLIRSAMNIVVKDHMDELIDLVIGKDSKDVLKKKMSRENILSSKEFISQVREYHIWNMMSTHASEIIARIQERKIYKLFCQLIVEDHEKSEKKEDLKTLDSQLENEINETLNELTDKNGTCFVYVESSQFSLASEEGGDPIFKIPFYKKATPHEYFYFSKQNRPKGLVEFVQSEVIIKIFFDAHSQSKIDVKKSLDDMKNYLCGKFETCVGKNRLEKIRKKFKFVESDF